MQIATWHILKDIVYYTQKVTKGVRKMGSRNKKRRRQKPTAQASAKRFVQDVLAGTLSGLIAAAVMKLLGW